MKHLDLEDFSSDNYRLRIEVPDSNFSRERNYQVIAGVIAENDKMQRDLNTEVERNAGNVADILTSFAKYKLDLGGGKQLEQWLGRENLNSLYSDKIKAKIELFEIIKAKNRKNGNTKFENYYLT
jgi:hypothetical protein